MIFCGECSLRDSFQQDLAQYHTERNHQGLRNELIERNDKVGSFGGKVHCRERLGGLLRYYYRDAAWPENKKISNEPWLNMRAQENNRLPCPFKTRDVADSIPKLGPNLIP